MIILIVDDDESCRTLIKAHLIKAKEAFYSFDIFEAETIYSCINICSERNPDIVLLDLDLPDSKSEDTISKINELSKIAAVIVLTSSERNEEAIDSMRAGAVDFLNKKVLMDNKIFIKVLSTAWARYEAEQIKETGKLPSIRVANISKEILEATKRSITDDELKILLEFASHAKSKIDELTKKTSKMFTAIYESNGSVSIKAQLELIKQTQEHILKLISNHEEFKKEKIIIRIASTWQFWVGIIASIAAIISAIITKM